MTSNISNARNIATWAPAIVFGGILSVFAVHATLYAPTMWAAAERLKAEQIAQEDKLFCERFRMDQTAESFATCSGYLSEMRRRHADRLNAEAAGWL
jgi:hypothetical protein